MLTSSHIAVANHFYTKLKQCRLSFNLNKNAFFKGNIQPDKQRHLFNAHFYAESKSDFERYYAKAKNVNLSDDERSEALGIVCHFMCDYFCKYHSIQPYKQAGWKEHLFYEIQLHLMLRLVLIRGYILRMSKLGKKIFEGFDLSVGVGKNGDIQALMDDYILQSESLINDLTYAFAAVRGVLIQNLGVEQVVFENEFSKKSISEFQNNLT
jgi:hypothetical protein